ncbi:disease resistance protein [Arabidopsis thaliana]|uniref:Receptor-like protein 38 n=1 Tax=Arabidopsis thaliana TaxID=3702 RepID=RLP38_ARATH|nr:receptor like protein 38 [Arabidopsis thaliana]Q9LS79.1 RecName: Full=Receptor-like protein 38; Short=AtRLP38; Flags: Precursor [Arabidopsis thaliana]AEE76720.1 receptor like protein 38 [Arabidopsis thaliana]BAB02104.1 disease resistance protein [Arabidopsis thaliana]|eukprot:NP_188953.1 receptor like protein 38 [Arabidopsis thaliana]
MIRSQSYCFLGITITIYFFFCLLPLPNTFASPPTQSLCRHDQRDALLELQKEFPIPSVILQNPWNKGIDCCSWGGVTCDAILGEVISLKLYFLSTASTSLKSSSALFKLQHLTHLDLSNCNLQGEIPSSIENLSHLTHLDLSTNHLVGEVPASIGNLNQLEYIDLRGNHLRGNIPTSFANLTKLSLLDLHENNFTGGDIVLSNLTSLAILDLSSNHFKSFFSADLSGLHNLEQIFGNENSFVGLFPASLLKISSLDKIQLSQNQFEGPIDFGNTSSSSRLTMLDISHNNFIGRVPSSLSKLVNLELLDLSHNNFRGLSPRSISKLVNLTSLDISYNKLEGQVPYFIWKPSNLQSVDLSHNSFFDLGKSVEVVNGAKLVGLNLGSNSLQGPIPQWICNFRFVFFLDLSDNRFTGSIPQCLKNSTDFNTLNLRNNSLSGFLPELCMDSTMLRSLDVSYNNFVGKLPKSLMNCQDMEFLNVRGNKIKDTFPFWLGSRKSLMVLVLRSNAFYGPVYNSTTYLGFPRLSIIDISNNDFVGSLPQDYFANWTEMATVWDINRLNYARNTSSRTIQYGGLQTIQRSNYVGDNFNMHADSMDLAYKGVDTDFNRIFRGFKVIDFSGNRFSGHIPRSIGLLSELLHLNLSGNAFTGNIPPSLANITNLETLDLSRNNLSGEIPRSLGNLSFLSNINFSHNHLQGFVPRSTQFGTQNCSSFVGNPGLYGLDEICRESHHVPVPTSQQHDGSSSELEEPVLNWIAAAIAFGPGVFCGFVIGHIFTSYKHLWFIAR